MRHHQRKGTSKTMPTQICHHSQQEEQLVRVLIVDDKPQVLRDLHHLLNLTGLVKIVGEAHNGLEAVRLVAEHHPDVVLMDLEMPVMDGYEATRQIKTNLPACRVIALSIHDGELERQKATQAGVNAFFVKGETLETLLETILDEK